MTYQPTKWDKLGDLLFLKGPFWVAVVFFIIFAFVMWHDAALTK